jgi:GNAT superfamily N-acetyltransferase
LITIIAAEARHAPVLAGLAEEMDRFYDAIEVEPTEVHRKRIKDSLFSTLTIYSLLAYSEGISVGFASYSFLWPAIGPTCSLYLKELYVISAARRKGVGKLLMKKLCDIALENRCSRLEWTTDTDNHEAQAFYSELGVPVKKSKLFYRVEGDELSRLAKS